MVNIKCVYTKEQCSPDMSTGGCLSNYANLKYTTIDLLPSTVCQIFMLNRRRHLFVERSLRVVPLYRPWRQYRRLEKKSPHTNTKWIVFIIFVANRVNNTPWYQRRKRNYNINRYICLYDSAIQYFFFG